MALRDRGLAPRPAGRWRCWRAIPFYGGGRRASRSHALRRSRQPSAPVVKVDVRASSSASRRRKRHHRPRAPRRDDLSGARAVVLSAGPQDFRRRQRRPHEPRAAALFAFAWPLPIEGGIETLPRNWRHRRSRKIAVEIEERWIRRSPSHGRAFGGGDRRSARHPPGSVATRQSTPSRGGPGREVTFRHDPRKVGTGFRQGSCFRNFKRGGSTAHLN